MQRNHLTLAVPAQAVFKAWAVMKAGDPTSSPLTAGCLSPSIWGDFWQGKAPQQPILPYQGPAGSWSGDSSIFEQFVMVLGCVLMIVQGIEINPFP